MATKVTDPHDLLIHKLNVMLTTEREIAKMLPTLQKEANERELAKGFERHLDETEQHIVNLEEALGALGEKPQSVPAPAIQGLAAQHKGFASAAADDVLPDVLDAVAVSSTAATEHHEIAAYESLIALARGLGHEQVVGILEGNLRQEQDMLSEAKRIAERLSQKVRQEAAEIS